MLLHTGGCDGKDCVCVNVYQSIIIILVSTKVDTKGWMTQLDNMNVYACVCVCLWYLCYLSVCV